MCYALPLQVAFVPPISVTDAKANKAIQKRWWPPVISVNLTNSEKQFCFSRAAPEGGSSQPLVYLARTRRSDAILSTNKFHVMLELIITLLKTRSDDSQLLPNRFCN